MITQPRKLCDRPFIHASMAGSRSTAPLNRSNSVLIVAPLSAFEICGYVAPSPSLQQNPSSGTAVLVEGVSLPPNAAVCYNPEPSRDQLVGNSSPEGHNGRFARDPGIIGKLISCQSPPSCRHEFLGFRKLA